MQAILARHGVRRIGAVGEPFDPERHEAVDVRETEDARTARSSILLGGSGSPIGVGRSLSSHDGAG